MLKHFIEILIFSCKTFLLSLLLVLWPEIVLAVRPYTPQLSDPLLDPWRWTHVAELEDKGVWNITESPDGTMWFGLDNGVAKYDGLKWHYLTNLDSTKNFAIIAICAAKDGSVYAGSTEDIYRFRNGRWKNLHLPFSFDFTNFSTGNSADNHRVIEPTFKSYSIIETFDGSIWIATLQGALQIKEGSMLLYSGKQAIPLNPSLPFCGQNRRKSIIFSNSFELSYCKYEQAVCKAPM